jgi:integrase
MRAGEVAGLTRVEIEHLHDTERAALTIKAERTNGRAHYVPLSPLAVTTIKEALVLAGEGEHVFAPPGEAIQGHALSVATRRLTDAQRTRGRFMARRSADAARLETHSATRLAALGVTGENRSAVLGTYTAAHHQAGV